VEVAENIPRDTPVENENPRSARGAKRGWKRRTKVAFVGLVALAAGGWWYVNGPVATRIAWGDDLDAALAAARQRDVPVVVQFTGPGCPYCWMMARSVLPVDEVESELDRFVAVRIDYSKQAEVAERFGIEVIPTFVVLRRDGNVAARVEGYQSVEEFTRFLRLSREGLARGGS